MSPRNIDDYLNQNGTQQSTLPLPRLNSALLYSLISSSQVNTVFFFIQIHALFPEEINKNVRKRFKVKESKRLVLDLSLIQSLWILLWEETHPPSKFHGYALHIFVLSRGNNPFQLTSHLRLLRVFKIPAVSQKKPLLFIAFFFYIFGNHCRCFCSFVFPHGVWLCSILAHATFCCTVSSGVSPLISCHITYSNRGSVDVTCHRNRLSHS